MRSPKLLKVDLTRDRFVQEVSYNMIVHMYIFYLGASLHAGVFSNEPPAAQMLCSIHSGTIDPEVCSSQRCVPEPTCDDAYSSVCVFVRKRDAGDRYSENAPATNQLVVNWLTYFDCCVFTS